MSNQILETLTKRWQGIEYPFFVHKNVDIKFSEIADQKSVDLSEVNSGDMVILLGI